MSAAGATAPAALDVDLTLETGEGRPFEIRGRFQVTAGITVLSGPSGCGKSTTLLAIAGLLRPDAGRIALGDHTVFDAARGLDVPPEQRRFGLVFQSLALFPHLSALANVAYGSRAASRRAREAEAGEWLQRMQVGHLGERRPSTFSGGEAQRVALARALAAAPRVLLLDEPFSALDEPLRDQLGDEVRRLVQELRLPTLLVTHQLGHAGRIGDRWLRMQHGVIEEGASATG
jgi:molybdate transport system ATP-binding protein